MPAPILPGNIRPDVRLSYGYSGPGGVKETAVAGGIPRVGLQYDRGPLRFTVGLKNKPDAQAAWMTFFLRKIAKGSLPFQMHLDSGFGVALHTVQMVAGTHSSRRSPNRVDTEVTFEVWAESLAYGLTSEEVDALLAFFEIYGDNSGALLERLDRFATVDTMVLS